MRSPCPCAKLDIEQTTVPDLLGQVCFVDAVNAVGAHEVRPMHDHFFGTVSPFTFTTLATAVTCRGSLFRCSRIRTGCRHKADRKLWHLEIKTPTTDGSDTRRSR